VVKLRQGVEQAQKSLLKKNICGERADKEEKMEEPYTSLKRREYLQQQVNRAKGRCFNGRKIHGRLKDGRASKGKNSGAGTKKRQEKPFAFDAIMPEWTAMVCGKKWRKISDPIQEKKPSFLRPGRKWIRAPRASGLATQKAPNDGSPLEEKKKEYSVTLLGEKVRRGGTACTGLQTASLEANVKKNYARMLEKIFHTGNSQLNFNKSL